LTRSFDIFHLTNVDISVKNSKGLVAWLIPVYLLLLLLLITGFLLGRKYVAKLLAAGKILTIFYLFFAKILKTK
jgi:hypothetical protein